MAIISHSLRPLITSACFLLLCAAIALSSEPDAKNKERGTPNRLAKESSPYLLQHAYNPVDWFPWGPEAFEKAKKEKKLIFMSVGYSSCHWCHVMEKESFSNKEVAEILNKNFVCIKVDREERPDIDEIYMAALSAISGRGGWPMSMFLTADGKPIVGGTYWPREDREIEGKKINGFKTILNTVLVVNKEKPKELQEQANEVAELTTRALERASKIVPIVDLDRALANGAAQSLRDDLDPVYGGISAKSRRFIGTKFPMPPSLMLLLDHARREKDKELLAQVTLTLEQMAHGGIYDQLGGGFHRYSTERTWTVPHFEKMLYDNAQLVALYSRAYQIDPRPEYRRIVQETLSFIKREMTSPEGGFYSALDADSNGTEGEFYVWTVGEIEKILGDKADVAIFRAAYGVTGAPNFEEKFHILKLSRPLKEVAKEQKLSEEELDKKLVVLRKKLFDVRAQRVRPFLDTKILTAWNGEMIAGYALAGQVFKEPEYIKAAATGANFLLKKLRTTDGRLLRSYSTKPDGKSEAKLNAYLDDYAFLVHGLLNLAEADKDKRWLNEAKNLTDRMIQWHGDGDKGGFFFTSSDHEKLFARPKDFTDGVQPSGNGVAVRNLIRLSAILKDGGYRQQAEQTMKRFAGVMRSDPSAVPGMCYDLHLYLDTFPVKATEKETKKLPVVDDPRKSEEVVTLDVKADKSTDPGKHALTIKLSIADSWHLYANPSGSKETATNETIVTIRSKGKAIPAEIVYPKGKKIEDKIVGDYSVYEGEVVIKATFKLEDGPFEVSVKIQACSGYGAEGRCLQPSTIKKSVK